MRIYIVHRAAIDMYCMNKQVVRQPILARASITCNTRILSALHFGLHCVPQLPSHAATAYASYVIMHNTKAVSIPLSHIDRALGLIGTTNVHSYTDFAAISDIDTRATSYGAQCYKTNLSIHCCKLTIK